MKSPHSWHRRLLENDQLRRPSECRKGHFSKLVFRVWETYSLVCRRIEISLDADLGEERRYEFVVVFGVL